eukprot:gnl/MRDRNA2_/MRDRNA2_34614_c0_seq1.p1 gnl/MRDRNA2_/MRDRNA2_34614_c0~~gnl/MRDRNA2_/MRDRNA2_34614_c0_seq1.p1  ORF type:complete len:1337 (-),score=256.62 gnl/MRDRNA2_/MRDRNA2_34614_c0_seq1:23-3802(-)
MYDVLLALHAAWLSRLSKSQEILVWTSHHGRKDQANDDMIGCHSAALPLRLQLKGSFREFLQDVVLTKEEAFQRWDVPQSFLHDLVHAEGGEGQNIFGFHDMSASVQLDSSVKERDLQVSSVELRKKGAKADAELSMIKDTQGNLSGTIVFNADLFSQVSAERMAVVFGTLAQGVVFDSLGTDMWSMPLLTPEQETELDSFHGAVCVEDLPTAPELFEACVRGSPDKIALEFEPTGEQMTYAELGARVYGLSSHLKGMGIGPNSLAALMCERSIEMTVAIYGLWTAGAAYLPIEPDVTKAHFEFVLDDLNVYCNSRGEPVSLLTQSHLLQKSTDDSDNMLRRSFHQILCLDTFKGCDMAGMSKPLLDRDNLAYCLYTTGSTGRPKGVLVQQRRTGLLAHNLQKTMPLTGDQVRAQTKPFSFNTSVDEWVWPLVKASKSVILKHNGHKDTSYMIDVVQNSGISVLIFVPPMLDLFLAHVEGMQTKPGQDVLPSLRVIYTSSDTLKESTIQKFHAVLPNVELHDMYGTTETARCALLTCSVANSRQFLSAGMAKTIGVPLDGCQFYITGAAERGTDMQRLPVGMEGELVVDSMSNAQGYLNLPEKTASTFIPNPFSKREDAGARAYRTGDVMKFRADGQLVYTGRMDFMVKVNGYRIELGEIEAACLRAPGVKEAVVVSHNTDMDAQQLVAYVSPSWISSEAVMNQCREVLPKHMVPSVVVGVDEWPRIRSKIDRKRLPPPPKAGTDDWQILKPSTSQDKKANESSSDYLSEVSLQIQELGLVRALNDEKLQAQGLNSFAIMKLHAKLLDGQKTSAGQRGDEKENEGETELQLGFIASVGHMWFILMLLVLLEWLVAYWEWYQAVPRIGGKFRVNEWPMVEKFNALGRFTGDPCFVMLAAMQDMRDAKMGNTSLLLRRTTLFILVAGLSAIMTRMVLQSTYVDNGWIDPSFAVDSSRSGSFSGSFTMARASFLPFTVLLSLGSCSTIYGIEWPWACLVFAVLIPAICQGIPKVYGTNDSFTTFALLGWMKTKVPYVVELCPYYFFYPVFVGGTRFPAWIVSQKQGKPGVRWFFTIAGFIGFIWWWKYLGINTTHAVDVINDSHSQWREILQRWNPDGSWPLLNNLVKSFDICAASQLGLLFVFLAFFMPTTPTIFSYLGSHALACYSMFPLAMIPAGHFVGAMLLNIPPPYRAHLVPIGVFTLLVLISALTSHPIVPDILIQWVNGRGELASIASAMRCCRQKLDRLQRFGLSQKLQKEML